MSNLQNRVKKLESTNNDRPIPKGIHPIFKNFPEIKTYGAFRKLINDYINNRKKEISEKEL